MSDLSNCLSTYVPKVIDFPISTHPVNDPVRWALDLFRAHPGMATLQVMKWDQTGMLDSAVDSLAATIEKATPGDASRRYTVLSKSERSMDIFVTGVQQGRAVHGRLDLFYVTPSKLYHRDQAQFLLDVFTIHFLEQLKQRSPFGIHAACTLWLSAGGHSYDAHLDLQDGFLFHLAGDKRLTVWPTPEKYLNQGVYSHEDFEGRMSLEPVEFQLKAGQVAFIPGGAIHKVDARGAEPCVSLSLHMGSPYPLLILRNELNRLLGEEAVYLPDRMCAPARYASYLFHPGDFLDPRLPQPDCMPDRLADTLLDFLQSKTLERVQLRNLLARWWETSRRELNYQGPYADEWRT